MKIDIKSHISQLATLLFLIILIILFSTLNEKFFTVTNLLNILRQVSMMGITAVGMTFIMISGGMDLSVGSLGALSGVVTAILMVNFNVPSGLAVVVTLVLCALIGMLTGMISNKFEIPPLITTLGTMTILRGVCYLLTKGLPIYGFDSSFAVIGSGYVAHIPIPVIIFLIIFVIGYFFLHKTSFGRYVYAVGGNREAARLSGVNVDRMKVLVFTVGAVLTGVAGIIMLSRLSSGQPSVMTGFEMDVITACVLGGISFTGGAGKMSGMFIGVLILGVLSNGLVIMDVDVYWQWVVNGGVLLLAVAMDNILKKNDLKVSAKRRALIKHGIGEAV